jgi:DNA polymerase, archaea type
MQIKGLAEDMGFKVLHGIVDCLWVIGEQYRVLRMLWSKKRAFLVRLTPMTGSLFLPMADGSGAYNRYFGRLDTGKMKIRGVMARKGDTPNYVSRMQQDLFNIWPRQGFLLDNHNAKLCIQTA